MNKYNLIIWILLSIIIEALFVFIRYGCRDIIKPKTLFIIMLIKFMSFIIIAFITIAVDNIFTLKTTYLFGAMYIVLLSDVITNIIMMVINIFYKSSNITLYNIIACILMIITIAYGTINSQVIKPNYITFNSDKIKNNHTFVFMSDIHYPTAQFKSSVKSALDEIKNLNPEFILLGGDITDEWTTYNDMKEIYESIGNLNIPTFFIYGNHDRQNDSYKIGRPKFDVDELEKIIKDNGIIILKDEWQQVSEDLIIVGREDVSEKQGRKKVEEIKNWPEDSYIICVDHSPYQKEDMMETGADLQLSGHTHAGQLFPLKTIYKPAVKYVYGKYLINNSPYNKYLYVSSGFSGWVLPFRNEEHCNYEVISLKSH